MTLQEFIDKYNGKGIDFDGSFGNQCQDLYRQYVKEVLGFPQSPAVVGAKDNWDAYLPAYFDRIPNTPTGVPQPGDIMIWGTKYGPYGHVAVVTSATVNTFTCFSQNDPIGSLCGLKTYKTYTPTLGWLHPKAPAQDTVYRGLDLTNVESMKVCVDDHLKIVDGQLVEKSLYETLKGQFTELQKQNDTLSKSLGDATASLNTANAALKTTQESLAKELASQHDWAEVAEKAQEERNQYRDFTELCLSQMETDLKIKTSSSTKEERIAIILATAVSGVELEAKYQGKIKDLEEENKQLLAMAKPIAEMTVGEIISQLIKTIMGR